MTCTSEVTHQLLVSYKRNSTYNTYVGMGYVIKGVDKALLDLCTGEKITVTVPPHLAYGGDGVGEFLLPASIFEGLLCM